MFIFSRRWMQRCIDELVSILGEGPLQKLVDRLNRPDDGRLAAMWELVFLRCLAHAGHLRHEVPLPGGRFPDFEWTIASEDERLCVWGDVTTVSDSGLDAKNPVDHLSAEITRLARKYGLNPNHFRYDVQGGRVGDYRKSSMELSLPDRPTLQRIIKSSVEPFVRHLAAAPSPAANFSCMEEGASFTVGYDQSQMFAGGGHPSYDVAVSLRNNPIFRALKRKTEQLAGAPEDAIRLLILCDADCASMSRQHVSATAYSSRAIAEDFLRQNRTIDLVLLATVVSASHGWQQRELVPKFDLVAARSGRRPARLNADSVAAVTIALNRVLSVFPKPVLEPINAARRCVERGYGNGMRGAYVNNKTIKISSRALLQLLAGEISRHFRTRTVGIGPRAAPGT